ncbi:class I mannose-6-phosphate isomerase [Chitinophaga pinensis]|uniref:Mannose-6-phosphate isomerase-like protein n=1 Tax=Chitinophaga pinensis (strain ATCC 43595 / DSM 2588 / LMG 13176 / NBRC 15968 / NCIMB 11800 / UQM 2034) TaxID=485918 RepID=A0A979GQE1_CHIPD|nr:class I mannose-6-phosphate isomerase [Chitinophaga pinensis]ACU59913.1 mannose-6-phosphate isomerase-like protein [Chitinophaga pinensis DSM 2588]
MLNAEKYITTQPGSAINTEGWRNSGQPLLPLQQSSLPEGYNIYPAHALGNGKIKEGYETLATWIAGHSQVLIDGYTGVFWEDIQAALEAIFAVKKIRVKWHYTAAAIKDTVTVDQLVAPFTGEHGAVWGTRTTLRLTDFFDKQKLAAIQPDPAYDVNIVIGIGASLTAWKAPLIYMDMPKNELQYRMRAGAAGNLATHTMDKSSEMYKRAYFVDWVVLNAHKAAIADDITVFADSQWGQTLTWIKAADLIAGIRHISQDTFRVRPWFEAGAWGGQWMKKHIAGLPQQEVNLAWSFEMIVPENGVLFESDHYLFEIPFEWLMFLQHKAILGKHAGIFGYEFPIRFDFLDTFDGGNLSIQCHPSMEYIREQFGETFTQDETYYILDCKAGAGVYLGFTEQIDPEQFKAILEYSQQHNQPVEITDYVQRHEAKKHDLFLIPNGTVHSAGADNLVLEISATPYIFTFKMYDWLRLGLDGQPRPINIDHAFRNLVFSRKGARVQQELISAPAVIQKGADWQLWHLPTHEQHFYDVERVELETSVSFDTTGRCLILMLVEGTTIAVKTANGKETLYQYAETFVIPAAADYYTLINKSPGTAKVVQAFLKEDHPVFSIISYEKTI